jgi:hypothetical protein
MPTDEYRANMLITDSGAVASATPFELELDQGFAPVISIARLMSRFPHPWYISGGWAIDLLIGRVTCAHCDIEVGIYRSDQLALQTFLSGWSMERALPDGKGVWVSWLPGEELQLPAFQIRARRADHEPNEFEFFLNERDETNWISRRHAGLRRPLAQVVTLCSRGIPILVPEIQLLYKAKHKREKDQADFDRVLPLLSFAQRTWLSEALASYHAGHPWLEQIAAIR